LLPHWSIGVVRVRGVRKALHPPAVHISHEAVREWEAKLAPVLAGELRRRRRDKGGAGRRSWFVDETLYLVGVSGRS
jgi:transposase-like protein